MQVVIPNVPDRLTYSVLTAVVVDVIAVIFLVSTGAVLAGVVPLALAVGVYWFVYRNLIDDVAAARPAAAIIAAAHLALAMAGAFDQDLFGFVFYAVVSGALGYLYVELGQTQRPASFARADLRETARGDRP